MQPPKQRLRFNAYHSTLSFNLRFPSRYVNAIYDTSQCISANQILCTVGKAFEPRARFRLKPNVGIPCKRVNPRLCGHGEHGRTWTEIRSLMRDSRCQHMVRQRDEQKRMRRGSDTGEGWNDTGQACPSGTGLPRERCNAPQPDGGASVGLRGPPRGAVPGRRQPEKRVRADDLPPGGALPGAGGRWSCLPRWLRWLRD
ncbi:MAG: hypothetical protein JWM27_2390 [Gemmatimonadetes bacterium]|nr:hypothetical protein [Gemmatimonadota bacterium]